MISADDIQHGIAAYRIQSPFQYAQDITATPESSEPSDLLSVEIGVWGRYITRKCRLQKHKGGTHVQVKEKGRWILLETSLKKNFPVSQNVADLDSLRAWWSENGQVFNWSGLPTELKEHVLQFCIGQPYMYTATWTNRKKYNREYQFKKGPHEILNLLGQWSALLQVSKQIRILVLRLCLSGCITRAEGLWIISKYHKDFAMTISRLGRFYQIVEPNGAPAHRDSHILARRYLYHPQHYPALTRYATYAHGIRRIDLQFNYPQTMHFFKVSAGGLDKYRDPRFMTCDVFERLPNLKSVGIWLPSEWWIQPPHQYPPILHPTHPCPRTLERWIYERIAEELSWLQNVTVKNFMDTIEAQMFRELHEAHSLSYTMTKAELDELYSDADGGISLEEVIFNDNDMGAETGSRTSSEQLPALFPGSLEELNEDGTPVLPPKCWCPVPCGEAFFQK